MTPSRPPAFAKHWAAALAATLALLLPFPVLAAPTGLAVKSPADAISHLLVQFPRNAATDVIGFETGIGRHWSLVTGHLL